MSIRSSYLEYSKLRDLSDTDISMGIKVFEMLEVSCKYAWSRTSSATDHP